MINQCYVTVERGLESYALSLFSRGYKLCDIFSLNKFNSETSQFLHHLANIIGLMVCHHHERNTKSK